MKNITYDDWKKCWEKNIKPLPIWWSCEDVRKKQYRECVHDYKQRQSEDPGEDL